MHLSHSDVVPLTYKVNQAANLLNIGRTSIYNLFRTGKLRKLVIAGRTVVPSEDLLALAGRRDEK
jgi:predicted site-specific integrase-resolvase